MNCKMDGLHFRVLNSSEKYYWMVIIGVTVSFYFGTEFEIKTRYCIIFFKIISKYHKMFHIQIDNRKPVQKYSDVFIHVKSSTGQKKTILGHKCILASYSKYFEDIFDSRLNSSQFDICLLENGQYEAFEKIIELIYEGTCLVNQKDYENFVKLATFLDVKIKRNMQKLENRNDTIIIKQTITIPKSSGEVNLTGVQNEFSSKVCSGNVQTIAENEFTDVTSPCNDNLEYTHEKKIGNSPVKRKIEKKNKNSVNLDNQPVTKKVKKLDLDKIFPDLKDAAIDNIGIKSPKSTKELEYENDDHNQVIHPDSKDTAIENIDIHSPKSTKDDQNQGMVSSFTDDLELDHGSEIYSDLTQTTNNSNLDEELLKSNFSKGDVTSKYSKYKCQKCDLFVPTMWDVRNHFEETHQKIEAEREIMIQFVEQLNEEKKEFKSMQNDVFDHDRFYTKYIQYQNAMQEIDRKVDNAKLNYNLLTKKQDVKNWYITHCALINNILKRNK